MLEAHQLTWTYPGAQSPALEDISLAVAPGASLGLSGLNGSGKSSLCLALAGLLPHLYPGRMQGRISIAGLDVASHPPGLLAGRVGLVLQNPLNQLSMARETVAEEVAFGLENLGLARAEMLPRITWALEQVGLLGLEARSPLALSGGQQQRLALAAILAMQPQVLVLDEPVSMLDAPGRADVAATLHTLVGQGLALVVAEHQYAWLAQVAGQHLALVDGKGSPTLLPLQTEPADGEAPAPDLSCLSDLTPGLPVRIVEVDYTYPDGTAALHGASLSLASGQALALVGANGSGKTSLARCLNGLLRPQQGEVWLGDWRASDYPIAALARRVGYVFQHPDEQLFARSVWDEVLFGPHNLRFSTERAQRVAQAALQALDLWPQRQTNPRDLGYSQRKRLATACALAMDTPILVLDEPTAGLDSLERARLAAVLRALQQAGKTLLLITHDLDFAARCGMPLLEMDNGRIVDAE